MVTKDGTTIPGTTTEQVIKLRIARRLLDPALAQASCFDSGALSTTGKADRPVLPGSGYPLGQL